MTDFTRFTPAQEWRPPQQAALFGQLTEDGQRIILVFQGDSWQGKQTGERLKHITPLISKAQGGAVTVPATWAAVTQVAFSFTGQDDTARWVPLPRLQAWILDEFTWRTAGPSPLKAEFPPWLKLRDYQVEGAAKIAAVRRFLLCDEPGLGKTATTIAGLAEIQARGGDIFPMVVVVPSWDVADGWVREIGTWAPGWHAELYGGTGRAELLKGFTPDVYITTYATARIDAADMNGPLVKLRAVTAVADEFHCVPHDTLITVPGGVKAICNIKSGDLVRGIDHATGQAIWTPVWHVMRSPLRPLIALPGGLRLTAEHPVWLSDDDSSLCYDNGYYTSLFQLRMVPAPVHESTREPEAPAAVLRPELLGEVADVPARVHSYTRHSETEGILAPERPEGQQVPGIPGLHRVEPESVQGHEPSYPGQGARDSGSTGLAKSSRWQRNGTYRAAGEIARLTRTGLGDGAAYPDRDAPGLWLPHQLQSGHREYGSESSDRGAWQRPRQERERQGPEKAGPADFTWLDGAMDMERADPDRSLWNLETGTGNYFADGILIHNCLKTNDAKQSRAFRRIARRAANVVELSGTPVTKDTGDIYPAADALDERSFPDRNRFVRRYCQTSLGEYGESIEGLNPLAEPEFRAVLLGQMRRVAKADVLTQLPPKIYSVRRVKIPPQWRKAYDQMEASMLADLPDGGELPAFATITQMMFLSRIASTAGDVSVTEEEDPVTGEVKKHYHYDMKAPSWKADVLMEILTERRGQPVAAFAPFKPLMMIAGQQAEAAGLRVGYITGIGDGVTRATRKKARTDFRDGKLDLIACTTGAGGVGIDGLQIAGTMVMLQRPWPLGDSIQSEDRLHRIGSEIHTHGVEIIDIVAEDTVDSRIRERLTEKAGQLGELVKDPRIVRELLGGLKP